MTALLDLDLLMHTLSLQKTIAAGDHPSFNLMCYSGGTAIIHFCCNGQPLELAAKSILAVQPSSAAVQRGSVL